MKPQLGSVIIRAHILVVTIPSQCLSCAAGSPCMWLARRIEQLQELAAFEAFQSCQHVRSWPLLGGVEACEVVTLQVLCIGRRNIARDYGFSFWQMPALGLITAGSPLLSRANALSHSTSCFGSSAQSHSSCLHPWPPRHAANDMRIVPSARASIITQDKAKTSWR